MQKPRGFKLSWLCDPYACEPFPSSASDKPWGRNGKRMQHSEFLRGAGRYPSTWGLEDVHLLARAFQIQHFTEFSCQGTLLPLTFFTRLTKIWLPIYLLGRKGILPLLSYLQKCPGQVVLCSGPGIAFWALKPTLGAAVLDLLYCSLENSGSLALCCIQKVA